LRLLDHDPELVVYGVTTGYGAKASVRLSPEERRQHARGVFLGPATSFGEPLPERVVRGIVLARFSNYLEGHSVSGAKPVAHRNMFSIHI
jgi:histidine ammonia-lyase